jgi:steroid 5-alpha reductase family enzyme
MSLTTPNSWFTILGPLTITILILKVSGIPMLEKKMAENPDFPEYKRKVSPFFPLPPRSS